MRNHRPRLALSLVCGLALLTLCPFAHAADTTEVDLNLLVAPTSPAFILLGVEPAAVPRPATPVDLAVTVLNESDNLSRLPENYAMDLAPYWLFGGGEDLNFDSYASGKVTGSSILQSLLISIGTTSRTDTTYDLSGTITNTSIATALGVGFSVSIARGRIDTAQADYVTLYQALVDSVTALGKLTDQQWRAALQEDGEYQALKSQLMEIGTEEGELEDSLAVLKADPGEHTIDAFAVETKMSGLAIVKQELQAAMTARTAAFKTEILNRVDSRRRSVKELASKLPTRRVGFKLDLAGGGVADFRDRDFDRGRVDRWGAWLTTGYEGRKLSLLAVGRVLDDEAASDKVKWDVGGRLILTDLRKVSLSAEGLYRTLNEGPLDNTYRIAFQADYAVAPNKSLSLTFGRDFEGRQSGNVLALLNLVLGFGSARNVQ